MANESWVRTVRRFRVGLLAGWALAGLGALGACGDEKPADGAICSEVVDRLRSCELLSEGEVNCRIFEQNGYGSCIVKCVRAASCDEIRAQTCDGTVNAYASCKTNCEFQAAAFRCGDGQMVSVDARCDGDADCSNGADERGCDAAPPSFDCGNGEQVDVYAQCDGASDCSNGRDEEGCRQHAETLCPGGF